MTDAWMVSVALGRRRRAASVLGLLAGVLAGPAFAQLPGDAQVELGGPPPPPPGAEETEDPSGLTPRERAAAVEAAAGSLLPLTPDEIRALRRRLDATSRASAAFPGADPRPAVRAETLSLDPGSPPPVLSLRPGFVTTLTMLDATGQPWPIYDLGFGGNFEVPVPASGSHVVRIAPLSDYGSGNLSIRLVDLATPITFRLEVGGSSVDYRYDARVPEFGPNAETPLIADRDLLAGDVVLSSVLDGVPPAGAQSVTVQGADRRTRAWIIADRLYLRTPLRLLSPAWEASVASGDGTTVYALAETPVALLSDDGAMVELRFTRPAPFSEQLTPQAAAEAATGLRPVSAFGSAREVGPQRAPTSTAPAAAPTVTRVGGAPATLPFSRARRADSAPPGDDADPSPARRADPPGDADPSLPAPGAAP